MQIAEEFEPKLSNFPLEVRRSILAHSRLLREYGPQLGCPRVDTLSTSRHANMKEMRFSAAGGSGGWPIDTPSFRRIRHDTTCYYSTILERVGR